MFGTEHANPWCGKYPNFLADGTVIVNRYNDFKFGVQEDGNDKLISRFYGMVKFALQKEQVCDLAKLMDIQETFPASSVDCERGFAP